MELLQNSLLHIHRCHLDVLHRRLVIQVQTKLVMHLQMHRQWEEEAGCRADRQSGT